MIVAVVDYCTECDEYTWVTEVADGRQLCYSCYIEYQRSLYDESM